MIWNQCAHWDLHKRCPQGFFTSERDIAWREEREAQARQLGWQTVGDTVPLWYCATHRREVTSLPFATESLKHDEQGRAAAKYFSTRMSEAQELALVASAKRGGYDPATTLRPWYARLWWAVVDVVRGR